MSSFSDDGHQVTGTSGGVTSVIIYNWDGKLRVAQYNSKIISIKYDPAGNRIWKNSSEAGTHKYNDIVGDLPVILLELDTGDDSVAKTYIYGNSQIIAQYDSDWRSENTNKYFYQHDRLGSVRQIIDASGNVKNRYIYRPFGEIYSDSHDFEETISNPFKFAGQYLDSEINEYYLRARQYDPYIGRFTSRDPVRGKFKEPRTLHVYLYCLNDPVNKLDPEGRFFGLANLLISSSMESQLRKMDLKFHMDIFRKAEAKIDAFSLMNLQRGVMYDLMVESIESDLRSTLQEAGIEALGLISPNLSRLLSFVMEVSDKSEVILNVLKGIKQWDDFIGEQIPETIIEELLSN